MPEAISTAPYTVALEKSALDNAALAPAHTAPEYGEHLQKLLPQGAAWNRAVGSRLGLFLFASGEELARLDALGRLLPLEANPLTAMAALEDWERVLGLPDACSPAGSTLQERREAVLAKLRDTGRQDMAFYYELAETLGYEVTIEEHWPFVCGLHECADPTGLPPRELQNHHEIGFCGPEEMRFWWKVTVHGNRLIVFRCGESLTPERLMDWRSAENLECLMRRYKEAHTRLTFEYEE